MDGRDTVPAVEWAWSLTALRSRANWVVYLMERDCWASGRADVAMRLNKSLDDILCSRKSAVVDAIDGLSGAYQFRQLAR